LACSFWPWIIKIISPIARYLLRTVFGVMWALLYGYVFYIGMPASLQTRDIFFIASVVGFLIHMGLGYIFRWEGKKRVSSY